MIISKERDIVLTSYERSSLVRFLALYLGSVFVLLAIIGYLFFENNRSSMLNAIKFEMMYQGRMLSSEIVMKAMKTTENMVESDIVEYLEKLDLCRFDVGYYDSDREPIYTQIENFKQFGKAFFIEGHSCFAIVEDYSEHLGVRYIVLRESELTKNLQALRIRIISYLVLSFILMGIVGYFLGRLFLQPVREQIESLDRFISDTTHELNTPISAILMTIQSLKNVEEKKLARLRASAQRLSMMYSSLTYRLEGIEEPDDFVDLEIVVNERIEMMKELIEAKRLKMKTDIEPFRMMISKRSAERLIDNLLSNAIKYSDVGDSIMVSLKDRVLKVQDTGIGMPHHVQADIFKRYERANKERGGFGIGLNIVLDICRRYGIRIDLISKEGEGSTFILTFPRDRSDFTLRYSSRY
ncbi:HAMP domain-containing sensor histidine kinase [Sulfurovum sp. zt1-1]|uniref:histidine kinase n=1 Tax=Sulfurovum zhangzhouensis TaxID=3019067 RepID=A0ABT7QWG5_9BACT|nr:HAMP domain-containing sensor histidine kinase [Sulfurovum zhangzhouensis]MDM5271178.1 HAMP domain-containing sensor histidine kinase [Sulfurovum zhangzhouensis]